MKVNRKNFLLFLKTINVSTMDKNSVNAVCIKWTDGKLRCNGLNAPQSVFVSIVENFNFDEMNNMYIQDLNTFISYVNGLKSDEIDIVVGRRTITLSDGIVSVSYVSGNEQSIVDKNPKISKEFQAKLECTQAFVDNLNKAVSIIREEVIYIDIGLTNVLCVVGNRNVGSNYATFEHPIVSSDVISCSHDVKLLTELIKNSNHYNKRTIYFDKSGKLKIECTKDDGAAIYLTQGNVINA